MAEQEQIRTLSWVVQPEDEGRCVGDVLQRRLKLSVRVLRRAKHVPQGITRNGEHVYTSFRVTAGDVLTVVVGDQPTAKARYDVVPAPDELMHLLDIRYEDEDILVCSKAAGMAVHPGLGHYDDTLANLCMRHYELTGDVSGFHPLQRLDMVTSGLLVVAKNPHAQQHTQELLHTDSFVREYLCVCEGCPDVWSGTIDAPIYNLPKDHEFAFNTWVVDPRGKYAVTHYWVLDSFDIPGVGVRSLVRLRLETGRTHQIRLHMSWIGCPLVGDERYGNVSPDIDRAALHSAYIRFQHPLSGEILEFEAPLPADMQALLG